MKQIINTWGDVIGTELELSDIVIGEQYRALKGVEPAYLEGDILVAQKLGKTNVIMTHPQYTEEKFYIHPSALQRIS